MTNSEQQFPETVEELIAHWRDLASQKSMHQKETFNARCETYAKCADCLTGDRDPTLADFGGGYGG